MDLLSILREMPLYGALYDRAGELLFATELMRARGPRNIEQLPRLLGGLQMAEDTDLQQQLRDRGTARTYARCADEQVWLLTLQSDERQGITALQLHDVSADYEDILKRRFLMELLEQTPDAIGIARQDRTGLWLNPAMTEMLKVDSPEQLTQHSIDSVQPDGIGGYSVDQALAHAREQGWFQAEGTMQDIRGETTAEISQVITFHQDPLDGRHFFSTLVRDISRLKQTERALQAARERLEERVQSKHEALKLSQKEVDYTTEVWRSLVEFSQNLVLFTDARGQVLFANQGFVPPGLPTLVGSSALALFQGGEQTRVEERFDSLIRGETNHVSFESPICCPAGKTRHCVVLINRLERSRGEHAATWILSDATEAKANREQLMANEKMAATGRMAARIAHEINNPLAAIKSSLELVRLDARPNDPAGEYLALMDQELDRVSNIIRQMYGLYRPRGDNVRPLDVDVILDDCLTLLASTARQRSVSIHRDAGVRAQAMATESSLRQILFNLLDNALDVSPTHGRVDIHLEQSDSQTRIHVCDQGPGISPEAQEKAFEPFFTTKESYSGSGLGLGLSVSASLAKGMGGKLELTNTDDGAAAILTLDAPAAL